MEIVQIVFDRELLRATDQAARKLKKNRSALVRVAIREHLQRLATSAKEERERVGYARHPQSVEEAKQWEAETVWPEE
ncbi:MAG TPA: ribbon-helix-helix protein, CopG family [Terriglobales bacterium]|nr:ribbon-helix-helix protein, CopG family [Terriglobales bacterium]